MDGPERDGTAAHCVPDVHGRCGVCADEGRVGRVIEVRDARSARVAFETGEEEVALDLLDDVRPGERLLVHGGFAIARLEDGAAEGTRA